jgi:hypothetical protein
MRTFRVRFTIRQVMIAVAVVALALVIVPPAYVRLAWLYNTPPTTLALFAAEVNPVLPTSPDNRPRPRICSTGQPFPVPCDYKTGLLPRVPSGLPYRVEVVVKLMDDLTKGTVFESHRESYVLVAGSESRNERRGRFTCELTPRTPGDFIVRYEVNFTDLYGRRALGACHTVGLEAK